MVKIDEFLVKEKLEDKVRLTLQVHDELVYEVDKDIVGKIDKKIENIMETLIPKEQTKGIIMKANASSGNNWKDME